MGYASKGAYYWVDRGCQGCHTSGPASRTTPYDTLAQVITSTMPTYDPSGCVDECATEVAGYIENARNPSFVYPFPEVTAQTIISEGFESGVVGQDPEGWSLFMGWNYYEPGNPAYSYNPSNDGNFARIDDSKSYSGTKSVHFLGGGPPAQIIKALPAGTDKLFIKAMVNMSRGMGNDPADNHEHIMGVKATPDANDEIRFGQIKGHLGTNEMPSDNIAPTQDLWGSGPEITPNEWHCVQLELRGDLSYNTVKAWVDGTLVHSIESGADWANGALSADWMAGKFNYVMFGFHSWSGNTVDVWMDDIEVSTEALVGCN